MADFTPIAEKMRRAGLGEPVIRSFERNYQALVAGSSTDIPEASIRPAVDLPRADQLPEGDDSLLSQAVVIKLNGGLGTSMGLSKAKSLLEVRDGQSFLDLIAKQVAWRRAQGAPTLRFLLMNSFSTSEDSRAALAKHPELGPPEELEFVQNKVPKLSASDFSAAQWAAQPELEWCPPGHGDLYLALAGSGKLAALLAEGVKYAFISNADNLGAWPDPAILRHFAESESSFLMEVTRRTESDKKGGHLAVRVADEQLVLREVAQCPEEDLERFQDIARHRFFNTNNLWVRLDRLQEALEANDGIFPLPCIRNQKTVDPREGDSPAVFQLETAMGAAVECFGDATALEVPRSRFAPVKLTSDLLALRSDAFQVTEDFRLELVAEREGQPPFIELDKKHYKLVEGLDALLATGVPSLAACQRLSVQGPARFAEGVRCQGEVTFENPGDEVAVIPAGTYQDEKVSLSGS
ncbi:MAG: UTP--glucose-1-phosphate uridylyltransferase [Verrucomicrobiota bacterium]